MDTPCLLWAGAVDKKSGYGRVLFQGVSTTAHKAMWVLQNGPVPEGKELDHRCRVRLCCEHTHLEPVTRRINIERGISHVARQMAQTTCSEGHPFDVVYKGKRHCLRCDRRRALASYHRRKLI